LVHPDPDRSVTVRTYLDFEKPIAELESKVSELKALEGDESVQISDEIKKLEQKAKNALVDTYGIASTTSTPSSRTSPRSRATAISRKTKPSWVALDGSGGARSWSSVTRRAPIRKRASATTSAWRSPRATARPSA
jgi:acetyl-CoA carboxylase alpha subunit